MVVTCGRPSVVFLGIRGSVWFHAHEDRVLETLLVWTLAMEAGAVNCGGASMPSCMLSIRTPLYPPRTHLSPKTPFFFLCLLVSKVAALSFPCIQLRVL